MEQLIVWITSAVNMRTLYPGSHPRVREALEQMVSSLAASLRERMIDAVTLLVVGDDLVIDQRIIRKATLPQHQFVQLLKRCGVERVTLAAGLDAAEADPFIASLAAGEQPSASAHIVLGRLQMTTEDDPARKSENLWSGPVAAVREAFSRFRTDHRLPIAPMEQIVWGFVDALSQSTREVLPLARLKEHDEYTFYHSVNVSLLVLAQAQSFGIRGPMLHAFGLAALLHDIGKLMVPLEVLNHPGKLEGDEWALMQRHCEQGAWYLSEVDGTSPLSIIVAFEHHLRFDGQPSYPQLRAPRAPNLVSRMTAIADAFDAMQTVRPYQKPLMRATALELLHERAGTFYDPLLVANFTHIVNAVGPQTS